MCPSHHPHKRSDISPTPIKKSPPSLATMGNTQNSLDGGEGDIGWCAAKREVKEHGQKPKLNFQRKQRNRKEDKNIEASGGLCAAPRVACLDGNGESDGGLPRRNRGQMTEWEKRKDMLKQRIRNKLNNAYKPENGKEFDGPCECRGLCVCHYKKAAKISDSAQSASDAFDARLKKIKDQIRKEKERGRRKKSFIDI